MDLAIVAAAGPSSTVLHSITFHSTVSLVPSRIYIFIIKRLNEIAGQYSSILVKSEGINIGNSIYLFDKILSRSQGGSGPVLLNRGEGQGSFHFYTLQLGFGDGCSPSWQGNVNRAANGTLSFIPICPAYMHLPI